MAAQPSPIDYLVSVEEWRRDDEKYFREVLKVQGERAWMCPLEPNPHQKIVLEEVRNQRKLGIPVRIIVLKPRKTGTSTISAAQIYREVRFNPADALIVAHDLDTTQYLFKIIQRFYSNAPKEERFPTEASNRKELLFAPRSDGKPGGGIGLATAGTKTVGRGFTPLYLQCSEAAFYENAETVMNSLLNSVPDTPESMIIIESTANGMGGLFHSMWQKAKAGTSAFKAIFLSWKDFPKYSLALKHPDRFEATLSSYEKQIRSRHGLTLEQLAWRRNTIETKCNGDAELFKQEYPLDDVEAFLTSGRGRFDRETIMSWPIQDDTRGFLELRESYSGKSIAFIPSKEGTVRLWKKPQPGRSYVLGADVAEGIEIEEAPNDDKYDYCSADVFDKDTGEQVCQLHGQFEPDEFGRQLAILGEWYHFAFLGVEANNHGLTTLKEIEHVGYPQSKIFHRTHTPDGNTYGSPQMGWKTTPVTRLGLIDRLAQSIRQSHLIWHSHETQMEMLAFVIKASGRVEANTGFKDDRVFSGAIALEMMSHVPLTESEEKGEVAMRAQSYRPRKYDFHRLM